MPRSLALLRLAVAAGVGLARWNPPARAAESAASPNRLIVLTDIEADPDDTESLVRLLLYSDVIDLQGLIATTSTHQRSMVAPESIRAVIQAYGQVQGNLAKHDANYPAAAALLSLVKQGLPVYGMQGVGPDRDSEGSEWIVRVLEQDPTPWPRRSIRSAPPRANRKCDA